MKIESVIIDDELFFLDASSTFYQQMLAFDQEVEAEDNAVDEDFVGSFPGISQ